jgi:hypothetical protein
MKIAETACRDLANILRYLVWKKRKSSNDDICLLFHFFIVVYFMALYLISSLDVSNVKVPDAYSVVRHPDTRVPVHRELFLGPK